MRTPRSDSSVWLPLPVLHRLGLALALAVALPSCAAEPASPATPTSPSSLEQLERAVHARVNDHRVSKGLAPLEWSEAIAGVARQHSLDMATGVAPFGHDGFDERVASIGQQMSWRSAGENLAMISDRDDPAGAVVARWLGSAGHRAAIEGSYTTTGIGAARDSDQAFYFTQIFVRAR